MTTVQRHRVERDRRDDGDGAGLGGSLDPLRQEGGRLLAAGDELIRRTLTGDSEKFLRDHRQMGGE